MSRAGGDGGAVINALNLANEAARFDELVTGYFRVATAATGRRAQPPSRGRASRRPPGAQQQAVSGAESSGMSPEGCLKQLKRLLRDAAPASQSAYVQRLFNAIIHQLERAKRTSTVFSRVVTLCREVFQRSVAFRALVATQTASFFDRLLVGAGEEPGSVASGGATRVSRALRGRARKSPQLAMVLALIETWKQDFGARYPPLVAGHALLMERGYEFPRERERVQEARQQEEDTRRHRERVCDAKKRQRDREMAQLVPEMEQVLVEMNRIFKILVPTLDAFQVEDRDAQSSQADAAGPVPPVAAGLSEQLRGERGIQGLEQEQLAPDRADKDDQVDSNGVEWEDVVPSVGANTETEGEGEDDAVEWEFVADTRVSSGYGDEDGIADQEQELLVASDGDEDSEHEQETAQSDMDINQIVQAYGLGSSSYQLTVEVPTRVCEPSADNAVLFGNLSDSALRIRKRFLPLLDDWEQHSTLAQPSPSGRVAGRSQHEVLQRIGDLRDRLTRALLKWGDLLQDSTAARSGRSSGVHSIVSVPLDAYDPPAKRQRRSDSRARR